MPRPSNRSRKRALVVSTAVVSVVALGILTNQLSDTFSAALVDRPYWYLFALAALAVLGVAAVYLSESNHGPLAPVDDEPGAPNGGSNAAARDSKPRKRTRIFVSRRPAVGALGEPCP